MKEATGHQEPLFLTIFIHSFVTALKHMTAGCCTGMGSPLASSLQAPLFSFPDISTLLSPASSLPPAKADIEALEHTHDTCSLDLYRCPPGRDVAVAMEKP